jgi:hypothetical protein
MTDELFGYGWFCEAYCANCPIIGEGKCNSTEMVAACIDAERLRLQIIESQSECRECECGEHEGYEKDMLTTEEGIDIEIPEDLGAVLHAVIDLYMKVKEENGE